MNKYELTLVLDGKGGAGKNLPAGGQGKKVVEKLEKILKVLGGAIKDSKEWGVKELAYKMGKSDTGLFLFFELELDPKGVKALNDKLRTDADIIRYLVVRKD